MTAVVDARRLEERRKGAIKSRVGRDRHQYFRSIAETRFVLRKVFRLVEEEAKLAGIDPLAHQALIQIYGSPAMELRVKEVAERLDIAPAFASSVVKSLVEKGYAARKRGTEDQRVAHITVTRAGRALLHRIDEQVQFHVDYFTGQLSQDQREAAISILMFYVGTSLGIPGKASAAKAI
jgi:DNA-binding MarR family transcriptional regulator